MGVLTGISEQGLKGHDKARLQLRLKCWDTALIPAILHIGHGTKLSKCKVDLHGREGHMSDNPQPPVPPPDTQEAISQQNRSGDHQLPYIPPWRRRHLGIQPPALDLVGRTAPAAQLGLDSHRSTTAINRPGPSNFSGTEDKRLSLLPPVRQEGQFSDLWQGNKERQPRDRYNSYHNRSRLDTCPSQLHLHHRRFWRETTVYERTCQRNDTSHLLQEHAGISSPVCNKLGGNHTNLCHPDTYHKSVSLPNNLIPINHRPRLFPSPLYASSPSPTKDCSPTFPSHPAKMSSLSQEDEALIQRFIGLRTDEPPPITVRLPQSAATSTDWESTLLVKVITDRTVMDNQFVSNMLIAWRIDPSTTFRPVMRNLYLVEFNSQEDLFSVSLGGPWTYRGDLVAFRKVSSHSDLHPAHIGFAKLWVQLHSLPLNSLTEEGLDIIGSQIGTPVSPPVDGFVNGLRFVKIKILVQLDKPLKDMVVFEHPTLGPLKVHYHYEKVYRICLFCGRLGHELVGCNDRKRLTEILLSPAYAGQYNMSQALAPKHGKWMLDPAFIPKEGGYFSVSRNKRHFGLDFQNSTSNQGLFGQDHHPENGPQVPVALSPSSSTSLAIPQPKRARPAGPDSPARDI